MNAEASVTVPGTAPGSVVVDPDLALVRGARDGDEIAFERLVQRHEGRLHRLACRLTGDVHEAEEIVSESFVRAWRALGNFREEARFGTWITTIVVNRSRSRLRTIRRALSALLRFGAGDDPEEGRMLEQIPDRGPLPEEVALERERRALLARSVERLTPEMREAFVLRDLEGHAYDEIATMLGLTLGAVKTRIHRARLHLAELVAADGKGASL